jgi:single-strand DNA-binding protein
MSTENNSGGGEKKSSGGAAVCKIALIGNIGVKPEWKHQEGQTPYCVFTMAVSRAKRVGGENDKQWFRVTLFGKLAEIAVRYGLKSQQVYVEGHLVVSEWSDRDGKPRYTLEVTGNDFQMLGNPLDALSKESQRLEAEAIRAEQAGQ